MTTAYDELIKRAVDQHLPTHDWRLLKAQLLAESNLNPNAVSSADAKGIAQFMPKTWGQMVRELGYPRGSSSPFNPDLAIPAAAYYMSTLYGGWSAPRPQLDRYCLALASYNAGFGNIIKAQKVAGGVNAYRKIIAALPTVTGSKSAETIAYVKRILHYYNQLVTG